MQAKKPVSRALEAQDSLGADINIDDFSRGSEVND
jgi:hypothetical protein